MNLQAAIILSVLFVICLFLIYLIYKVYNLQKPAPGNCDILKQQNPDLKWSKDCAYIQELEEDSSIPTPTTSLYLSSFTTSTGSGPAWGANVWYRYRYVKGDTGKYSKFSPWTNSPIMAGASNLPCTPTSSTCPGSFKSVGKDSCTANLPTLQLNGDNVVTLSNNMFINVHRYVAESSNTRQPSGKISDNIVGMMIPKGNSGNFIYIDTSESPCKEIGCNTTKGC